MEEKTLQEYATELRKEFGCREKILRSMKEDKFFDGEEAYPGQFGEVKAQIMLTVRHIEDARMRLGKVLQYAGDGISILDK